MRPLHGSILLLACVLGCVRAAPAQLRQVALIEVPGQPGFDAAVFVGKYLVIAHRAANTLDIFDPTKRRVVGQVKDLSDPRGMAVDTENARLYVANAGSSSISVISIASWKVDETIKLPGPADSLLLVPSRKMLFAASRPLEAIFVVPTANVQSVSTLALEGAPQTMAFDPTQDLVFASLQGVAEIVGLDRSNAAVRRFRLNASQPTGLAFDSQARKLYVAVRSAVLVLDPRSGAEVARVPSADGTNALWLDPATKRLFASSDDGYVNVIKTENGRYFSEEEFRAEVRGHALAVDPARNFVYLPGGREGHSKVAILERTENPNRSATQEASRPGDQPTASQVAQRK